ncbi:HNH endonuclease [Rhizobium rhizogenes]|uniref:HNH endonuclease n=1 Tax=Rhizobium rhizogenes TaxID=359 RepID=UPI0015717B42|nr:HNH endonuclease [Rhizobium rhizogenes]
MPLSPPTHKLKRPVGATRHVVADERLFRPWYKSRLWTKVLRPQTMLRDGYACQMCGRNWGHDTSRLVVDHVKPHRGVWSLFADPNNLQSLCDHPCHSKHKQRMEQGL